MQFLKEEIEEISLLCSSGDDHSKRNGSPKPYLFFHKQHSSSLRRSKKKLGGRERRTVNQSRVLFDVVIIMLVAVITGSAGWLGDALAETCIRRGWAVRGIDLRQSRHTTHVGSVCDRQLVASVVSGANIIFHTGALHKPHVESHTAAQVRAKEEGSKKRGGAGG